MSKEGEGGRPPSPTGSVGSAYSWSSARSDAGDGDGDGKDGASRVHKPAQIELLSTLAKLGGDVDELSDAPKDGGGAAGGGSGGTGGAAGGEGEGEKEKEEVDDSDIAVQTAVVSLPPAPLTSLRGILEREDDPTAAQNTVLVWYFAPVAAASGLAWCEKAARPISVLRAAKDYICLPMGFTVLQDLWTWACKALGYELWQCIWYPVPDVFPVQKHQMQDVHERVVRALRTLPLPLDAAGDPMQMILVPFNKPRLLVSLCEAADITVFGDSLETIARKDVLHPRPKGPDDAMAEYLLHPATAEPLPIHVPRGFTCFNRDELLVADTIMRDAGIKIVLKPSWESAGKGIIIGVDRATVESYEWDPEKGVIVLEEFLDADKKADGSLLLPVVHCLARSQYGDIVEQLVTGTTTYNGTVSPCRVEPTAKDKVKMATELLADTLDMSGFWGVDYLLVKGEPYLIDLNTGRPNGGHVPKIFAARFAPKKPFKSWKDREVPEHASVLAVHRNMLESGLSFDKAAKRGIVVLHLFPGMIGSYLAIGRNEEDLTDLLAAWDANKESVYAARED